MPEAFFFFPLLGRATCHDHHDRLIPRLLTITKAARGTLFLPLHQSKLPATLSALFIRSYSFLTIRLN